ncbi:hypothetical protein Tco_1241238 [Tanacetum coccineum]
MYNSTIYTKGMAAMVNSRPYFNGENILHCCYSHHFIPLKVPCRLANMCQTFSNWDQVSTNFLAYEAIKLLSTPKKVYNRKLSYTKTIRKFRVLHLDSHFCCDGVSQCRLRKLLQLIGSARNFLDLKSLAGRLGLREDFGGPYPDR